MSFERFDQVDLVVYPKYFRDSRRVGVEILVNPTVNEWWDKTEKVMKGDRDWITREILCIEDISRFPELMDARDNFMKISKRWRQTPVPRCVEMVVSIKRLMHYRKYAALGMTGRF